MTAHERPQLAAREYVARVEREFDDLPAENRRKVLADLGTHLAERGPGADLRAELGPPEEYARDLRAALGLQPPPTSGRRPRKLRRLAAAVAAIGVAAVAGVVLTHDGGSGTAPTAPTRVVVPDVMGMGQAEAVRRLHDVGLTVESSGISTVPADLAVVEQAPAAGSAVAVGSSVTLRLHSP